MSFTDPNLDIYHFQLKLEHPIFVILGDISYLFLGFVMMFFGEIKLKLSLLLVCENCPPIIPFVLSDFPPKDLITEVPIPLVDEFSC